MKPTKVFAEVETPILQAKRASSNRPQHANDWDYSFEQSSEGQVLLADLSMPRWCRIPTNLSAIPQCCSLFRTCSLISKQSVYNIDMHLQTKSTSTQPASLHVLLLLLSLPRYKTYSKLQDPLMFLIQKNKSKKRLDPLHANISWPLFEVEMPAGFQTSTKNT